MRNYDLTLIFSPLLAQEEANDVFQALASFIQEEGGILESQSILGKRPLLAPIKKAKEGYLATITFSLAEEKLVALEKKCKAEERMLRFFLMKSIKKTKKAKIAPLTPAEPASVSPTQQKREDKIDLKNIDEKLEEIFKEQ